MSTYYYGTLYKKRKNGWDIVEKNLDVNCIKDLTGYYSEANEVYNVDEELKELVRKNEFFFTYKFLGYVHKEDYNISTNSLNQGTDYINEELGGTWNEKEPKPLVFYESDFSELESLIPNIDKNLTITDLNVNKLYSVFVRLKNYYKGNFYGVSSFDDVINDSKHKLEEINDNKRKWESIRYSLEYLKLSDEEKDNVYKSLEYEIEDEDNYYTNKLDSAEMLKHTLQVFNDTYESDNNAYFYIYSDGSYELQNIPNWLEGKVSRW